MATRITSTFPNLFGSTYVVTIDDSAHVGAATVVELAEPGFTTNWNGNADDLQNPIIGSSTTIPIIVTDATLSAMESFATDLIGAEEGRFTVKITKAGNIWWCGYVLQDISRFEDRGTYIFSLKATDGIARLKDVDFVDVTLTPDGPFGVQSFIDIITFCLTQGTLASTYYSSGGIFLRTVINWVDANLGAPAANDCPLANTQVDGAIFAKSKDTPDEPWEFMSCYDVLKAVCIGWGARLYYANGSFRIEQIRERAQDTLFERRFDLDGVFVSGTATAAYDLEITQTGNKHRLAGGSFGYLPALNRVEVSYDHFTLRNRLENKQFNWNNSTAQNTVTITSFDSDSDTFLRINGTVSFTCAISTYTEPWRYVMGMFIGIGTDELSSVTTAEQTPGGQYTMNIKRATPAWVSATGSNYYEISTPFFTSVSGYTTVSFSFETPIPIPAGDSIVVKFAGIGARFRNGATPVVAFSSYSWSIPFVQLSILGSDDPLTYIEKVRTYTLDNPDTGNSLESKVKVLFGHAVRKWTDAKLITDGTTTTATWDYDTETENLEFGALLAAEIMRLREKPTLTYQGEFLGDTNLDFHRRLILPDNTALLPFQASFSAMDASLSGEWFEAGINAFTYVVITKDKSKGGGITDPSFGLAMLPGSFNPQNGFTNVSENVNFLGAAANYLDTTVTAGSVTTIDLEFAVAPNSFLANDEIYLFDPQSGVMTPLTVTTTAAGGATSLSVSGTAAVDMPVGSYIIYSHLNHYTTQGGATSGTSLPPGTTSQTLRHDGSSWVATSIIRNDGTQAAVGAAPSSSYMFLVKQTGASSSTNGIGVERSGSTNVAAIYHNGAATFESIGGNNLALKTASGSLINLISGGGGGQLSQVQIAPGANITTALGNAALFNVFGTYAPTASGGDFSLHRIGSTINQTGSADQPVYAFLINPTLTAVAVAFRGIYYAPSTQTFLYQPTGTGVVNHLLGNLGIGTGTTSPGAKLDIVGNGNTSSTFGLKVSNSGPTIILSVRDDQRVGVLTTSPAVTLDAIAATDAVGLPTGTTGQRPSVNSSLRLNSTVGGLEVRNAGAWNRITCTTTPTIEEGPAAGTSPTVAVDSGNDLCHQITVTTGTSTTTGVLCTVTFAQGLDAGLFTFVVFSARNEHAAAETAKFYVSSAGNSSYAISCRAAPTASTAFTFHVMVKQ